MKEAAGCCIGVVVCVIIMAVLNSAFGNHGNPYAFLWPAAIITAIVLAACGLSQK